MRLALNEKTDNKNIVSIFRSAASNNKFNKYLWFFIKNNWTAIYDRFKETQSQIYDLIETLATLQDITHVLIPDIYAFFKKQDLVHLLEKSLDKTLEEIELFASAPLGARSSTQEELNINFSQRFI